MSQAQHSAHTLEPPKRGVFKSPVIDLFLWVCGLSAFGLALWGWLVFGCPQPGTAPCLEADRPIPVFDLLVRSVKVLLLSDIYYDHLPSENWQLHTARVLGVAFSMLLAGRVILFAMRAFLTRRVLSGRKGHEIVMGWGLAAQAYSSVSGGREVTHIAAEISTSSGRYAFLERQGSIETQLDAAGVRKACRILVDEGDDALTWQVAQTAARTARGTDTSVLAFISDPWLLERLDRADSEAGVNTFSYAGGVARQVMLAHPPYLLARKYKAPAQHILIIGFGAVGQSLAREFLVTSVSGDPEPMMITAIDPSMERLKSDFLARHPGLAGHVDIALLDGDIRHEAGDLMEALSTRLAKAGPCAVYIAIDDSSRPFSMAVAVRDQAMRHGLFRAPVFVCATQGAGLHPVRQGAGLIGEPAATLPELEAVQARAQTANQLCDLRLVTFGSWKDALDGSGLLEPDLDWQARQFHDGYRKLLQDAGHLDPARPSHRSWDKLPDEYRVANRRAAAHVRAKLDAAGYDGLDAWLQDAVDGRYCHDLPPEPDALENLSGEALARMGEMEHTRWVLDRALTGWRFGEPRDDLRRIHNMMRSNSELDEEEKTKDRNNVLQTARIIREIVARAAGGKRKRK